MPLSVATVGLAVFPANLDDVMLTSVTLVSDVPATCNAPPCSALHKQHEAEGHAQQS